MHPLYAKQWKFELPASFSQRLDSPGRPRAHADFIKSHDVLVGRIAADNERRWRKRHNFYLNCLRDVDRNIGTILDELDAVGLTAKTIVILTADHGDLDGAQRLHAKGATSYREQNQVPLILAHRAYPQGENLQGGDFAFRHRAHVGESDKRQRRQKKAITRNLTGKNFSTILAAPERATHVAVRDGQLFCYNMFAYLDGDFFEKAAQYLLQPDGKTRIKESGLRPDITRRGAIRTVFDRRYQFSRYFSPKQHNRPASIEALFNLNDIELFDLQTHPLELNNLALDSKKNGDLIALMNAKLNKLLDAEVGGDVGQMLPGGVDGGWVATAAARDL